MSFLRVDKDFCAAVYFWEIKRGNFKAIFQLQNLKKTEQVELYKKRLFTLDWTILSEDVIGEL